MTDMKRHFSPYVKVEKREFSTSYEMPESAKKEAVEVAYEIIGEYSPKIIHKENILVKIEDLKEEGVMGLCIMPECDGDPYIIKISSHIEVGDPLRGLTPYEIFRSIVLHEALHIVHWMIWSQKANQKILASISLDKAERAGYLVAVHFLDEVTAELLTELFLQTVRRVEKRKISSSYFAGKEYPGITMVYNELVRPLVEIMGKMWGMEETNTIEKLNRISTSETFLEECFEGIEPAKIERLAEILLKLYPYYTDCVRYMFGFENVKKLEQELLSIFD